MEAPWWSAFGHAPISFRRICSVMPAASRRSIASLQHARRRRRRPRRARMPPGVPTDAFALLDGWRGIAAWVLTGGAKRRDEWPRLPMSVGFPTDAKTALRQVSLYVT